MLLASSSTNELNRDIILAYSYLYAFHSHWPSQSSELIKLQIDRWSFIKDIEKERFLKQRRIALGQISSLLSEETSSFGHELQS